MSGPGSDAPARRRPRSGLVLIAVLLTLVCGREAVAEPFHIVSSSMAPTLLAGDHVLVSKLPGRASPGRGDLAVFHAPDTGDIVLKRVVGLPGDSVGVEDGRLVVDGRVVREPYADPGAIDGVFFGPVTVGDGEFFVLGDNRLDSTDSRDFGPVPESAAIGSVVARIWPPSRWGAP